jgi:hypothetical protein
MEVLKQWYDTTVQCAPAKFLIDGLLHTVGKEGRGEQNVTHGQRVPVEVTHRRFVSVSKQAAWMLLVVSLCFIFKTMATSRVGNEELVMSVMRSKKSEVICTFLFKFNRSQYV